MKKKASSWHEITTAIYSGAWNNLELHVSSKKTLAVGAALIGGGLIIGLVLSKGQKK